MEVWVNKNTPTVVHNTDWVADGYVIVKTSAGLHYISEDKVYFVPMDQIEDAVKRETVRNIFGVE